MAYPRIIVVFSIRRVYSCRILVQRRTPKTYDGLRGTFAPLRRASERPMAIACLRLLTFLPDLPDLRVPSFISWTARFTVCEAFGPYFLPRDLLGMAAFLFESCATSGCWCRLIHRDGLAYGRSQSVCHRCRGLFVEVRRRGDSRSRKHRHVLRVRLSGSGPSSYFRPGFDAKAGSVVHYGIITYCRGGIRSSGYRNLGVLGTPPATSVRQQKNDVRVLVVVIRFRGGKKTDRMLGVHPIRSRASFRDWPARLLGEVTL
jgi:hypothetical protein